MNEINTSLKVYSGPGKQKNSRNNLPVELNKKSILISYSGGDGAIRLEHSRAIAYGKLGTLHMAKNGIFYRLDVLFMHTRGNKCYRTFICKTFRV